MKLDIDYSVDKDAQTYVNFVYTFKAYEHGRRDLKDKLLKKLDPQLQTIITTADSEKSAYDGVCAYLEKYRQGNKEEIEMNINRLKEKWEQVGGTIIKFLEFLYQNEFPFEKITAYLTTNNIFPYNYKQRYFYTNAAYFMTTAKHELNHFMFYYYYPKLNKHLDNEKYELLKESLAFFSNPEEGGKPNELPLRKLYKSKIWKNMDEAVEAGVALLTRN